MDQACVQPESIERQYDVAVIGGGPAGAALATFLARKGRRCAVFEKARFPRYHIGESLIPDTYGVLDRLELLPKLRDSDYPVKHSVRFVPHDGKEPVPFYFSETIEGDRAHTWQVERSTFDLMMLRHAAPLRPVAVTWMGGLAVGAFAASALSLFHEIDATVMALAWNLGSAAGIVSLGALFGLRIFEWAGPRLPGRPAP